MAVALMLLVGILAMTALAEETDDDGEAEQQREHDRQTDAPDTGDMPAADETANADEPAGRDETAGTNGMAGRDETEDAENGGMTSAPGGLPDYPQQGGLPNDDGDQPFTPPGAGTVVDNATDSEGKEFFTIRTADGDIFYLIIDRQRSSDNVYFLNAVTEEDLLALAEENGRELTGGRSGNRAGAGSGDEGEDPDDAPEPGSGNGRGDAKSNTMYIALAAVFIAACGIVYYIKIVKGKRGPTYDDEDEEDEDEDDDEYGYEDDTDESGGEPGEPGGGW